MSNALSQPAPVVYLNGEFIPFPEARLPIYDLGLVQGASISERLRTVRHIPYLVEPHLDRLQQALARLGWHLPLDAGPLEDVISQIAERNASLIGRDEDLAIVLFVTAGQALGDANGCARSSRPSVCVYSAPLPLSVWARGYRRGISLVTPRTRHLPAEVVDPSIKNRSRLHWHIAETEARRIDPHAWALLLDRYDYVTETSSGNLFVVQDEELLTPSQATTLPGISQAQALRLARQQGGRARHADLTVDDVASADECFLTSSTYCILPVSRINGRPIGTAMPGRITKMLIDNWSAELGLDFEQQALHAEDADAESG